MSTGSPASAKTRTTIGSILQIVLTHESRLAATAHEFEWRVQGSPLQSIKRLFAEQSRQIDRWLNDVSECARTLGVREAARELSGEDANSPDSGTAPRAAARELLLRHETIACELRGALDGAHDREANNDAAMLLGGLLEFHETSAWILRLLLESPERARVV
jgi:DNA-binding ferritin-like protein